MTMSNQCKWISFGVMSLTVILLLLLFYGLEARSKCPEDGQLRYREDKHCYQKNTRGPCKHSFIYTEDEPRSHFGACSCPYMLTNRSIVHHDNTCYYVFTKAYCPDGHWLNVTRKGDPVCVTNTCLQHARNDFEANQNANDDGDVDLKSKDQYDQQAHNTNGHREEIKRMDVEWVPINGGGCARLNQHSEGCPEGSVVRFHQNYIMPSCYDPPKRKFGMSTSAIGVGAYTTCPLGSAKAITGLCQPLFDFDFEEPNQKSKGSTS